MSTKTDSGRPYHSECTGLALETVNKHQQPADISLFGSCFCPFVQRVWVALEYLGVPYKVGYFSMLTDNNTDIFDSLQYRKSYSLT